MRQFSFDGRCRRGDFVERGEVAHATVTVEINNFNWMSLLARVSIVPLAGTFDCPLADGQAPFSLARVVII